ncbi:MAG: TlpA disulfide reductase family protein [Bacteroidota bacterium]
MRYLILVTWFGLLGLWSCPSSSSSEVVESAPVEAPSEGFFLPDADSLSFPVVTDFEELAPLFALSNDTVYVVNFWATWCAPCVEELPYFEQLATELADQPVRFAMISLDFKRNLNSKLQKFIDERPFELPVIALVDHRSNVWIDRVEPTWSGAIPVTIVYRNGQRTFYEEQFEDYEDLQEIVLAQLNADQ